ncbi:hypothetical protein SERLA73DRAFT_74484 [Serpula lacrymans var. lacrymans S7.3]|uniref:Uncharacterized protein n=2 Tax=Serpula lacrymans var. lacrymans TaxID=341189 RepID=F8PZD7_SERL3|nr:uncharacterized protein SERLADRAFT_439136 [Serpula lacrymans var. lacrymans S7.9]EGN98259.1 hypothetical protein SERLA73DRAFT_74484 [Serpula lacrymans var. lacrymans S7.3]EGO23833.1 hypothetical protein SERLADRAFT_439136 [Serpula lacrymans var. lacrymans S7.9]
MPILVHEAISDNKDGPSAPPDLTASPKLGVSQLDKNIPWIHMEMDEYRVFHVYPRNLPSYNPKDTNYYDQICDSDTFKTTDGVTDISKPWFAGSGASINLLQENFFTLFLNATTFRLMSWFYNSSSSKSLADLDRLANSVILAEDFNCQDLKGFSAAHEALVMDNTNNKGSGFFSSDKWIETSVKIKLPAKKVKFNLGQDAPELEIPGLYYCKPLKVIKSALEEVLSRVFQFTPYKIFCHQDETEPPERIITEIYTSDAMLKKHKSVKAKSLQAICTLETVVASIMLWSDSTHLASFGNAAL